jgi:hypothetical protein
MAQVYEDQPLVVRDFQTGRAIVEGMIEQGEPLPAVELALRGMELDEDSIAALWLLAFAGCDHHGAPVFAGRVL